MSPPIPVLARAARSRTGFRVSRAGRSRLHICVDAVGVCGGCAVMILATRIGSSAVTVHAGAARLVTGAALLRTGLHGARIDVGRCGRLCGSGGDNKHAGSGSEDEFCKHVGFPCVGFRSTFSGCLKRSSASRACWLQRKSIGSDIKIVTAANRRPN